MSDYRLSCRHCGGRFVEMKDLAFHPCPAQPDTRRRRRSADRQPARGKVRIKTQRRSEAGGGAR
jgi:hypothetical protein